MKDVTKLDQPLNADERLLYGINVRLDVLINQFSSFLEVYANQNKVATTSNKVIEKVTVEPVVEKEVVKDEVIEEVIEEVKPKAKRTTTKK